MEALLDFQSVSMRYHGLSGETSVLEDFSLQVQQGEFISLLGPSGCGKSTILSLAAGLLQPDLGRVLLRGEPIERPPYHMGYMLQHDHLFSWLTVRNNALLGLKVRGEVTAAACARVDGLLAACGLTDFAQAFPQQLSGGMRQRVALVRTLAMDPDFLLLDEPFSALDSQTRLKLSDEVKQMILGDSKAAAALLVTHDVSEAISMSDRIVVLSRRPARIKSIHEIHLPGTPMQRRSDPGFQDYFDLLWKELDVHVI